MLSAVGGQSASQSAPHSRACLSGRGMSPRPQQDEILTPSSDVGFPHTKQFCDPSWVACD